MMMEENGGRRSFRFPKTLLAFMILVYGAVFLLLLCKL